MFDVLAGFYGTVVVEVGREVAVTANLCSRIGEQQEAEKGFKALFLCVGAGVGGTSGSVQASFVGNSYRRGVVAFGVGADMSDVAHVMYRSIFGDVIVIATFGKALAFVHGVEGFRGEVACTTGCGAVHHNQGDVSLFNHCFLWVIFSCVSGAGALNIDYKARTVEIDGVVLKEGDYISLNVIWKLLIN